MALIDSGLELLDEQECWTLLRRGSVGRVGVSIGALPAIFPVNYSIIDDEIVFCTAPGTKLNAALQHAIVAFEVDDFDTATRTGWSVLAVGEAAEVHDVDLLRAIFVVGHEPWAGGDRSHLVAIRPELLSGRRIPG